MEANGNQLHRSGLRLRAALLHPRRLAILDYLGADRVGIGEDELAAALDLTVAQVRYHLKVLAQAHLVSAVDEDWTRRAGGRFYVSAVA